MNVAAALAIREGDRERLETLARSSSLAERALIVLLAADGMANTEIARLVGMSRPTVLKWRHRYEAHGLAGLDDGPRPGRPPTIDEVEVLGETLADGGKPPPQFGVLHWSARLMANRLGISFASVARIWRKYDIRPNRLESFTLAADPALPSRLHGVVGLYLSPAVAALVMSTGTAFRADGVHLKAPTLRLVHGTPEQNPDHCRGGTAGLFTALAVVVGRITARERDSPGTRALFMDFLDEASAAHPGVSLRVVCDNYVNHPDAELRAWREANPHVVLHFAPAGRSWLTVVGICCAIAARQAIRRGVDAALDDLESEMRAYIDSDGHRAGPFTWIENAHHAAAISKCKSINNTQ